jgi:hypothetical protein
MCSGMRPERSVPQLCRSLYGRFNKVRVRHGRLSAGSLFVQEAGGYACTGRRAFLGEREELHVFKRMMEISSARKIAVVAAILLAATVVAAQENPPHDMGQMNKGTDHGFMQEGMHHAFAKGVELTANVDTAAHVVILREGPLTLPAHTLHMAMPQPHDQIWPVPFDGWLLAYHPRLVDAGGNSVPGRVLHHTAFWNVDRSDFLCPNKEEHIFGAGSEMTDWAQLPGFGYRVQKGDRIRIETMVYNPTDISYDKVFLEVRIDYRDESAGGFKGVYPAWMDVQSCGESSYDLPAGESSKTGTVAVNYSGVLLGVGGHLHDYGQQLVLRDATKNETVATLDARVGSNGELLGIPVAIFLQTGGYRFNKGDQLEITAKYDNLSGKDLHWGAMGIVVGYFAPDDDSLMASLRRARRPTAKAASD